MTVTALIRFQLFSWILLCYLLTTYVRASSVISPIISRRDLAPRAKFVLNNATGTPQVFSPATGQPIPQGLATDGSGINLSPPALIWIIFCLLIGIPMSLAGIRGWRFTTGVGIGLSGAVCSWAAFINTVNAIGVPDTVLTAFVLAFFFLGFILGLFEFGRLAGLATLGITGGLAFGIRIMMLKQDLLFSGFPVNWILTALFGILGGLAIVWLRVQRAGILFGAASVGTFLSFLGIDLVINRQSGMSRGLRFLFDRNSSHILDIITHGYKPPVSTRILLAISLGFTPILAYVQHCVFKHPFSRNLRPEFEISEPIPMHGEKLIKPQRQTFLSGLWDGGNFKSGNRFSV